MEDEQRERFKRRYNLLIDAISVLAVAATTLLPQVEVVNIDRITQGHEETVR